MIKRWSTFSAFAVWGASAFMAQPTVGSFITNFIIIPLGLLCTILLARWEGRKDERAKQDPISPAAQ